MNPLTNAVSFVSFKLLRIKSYSFFQLLSDSMVPNAHVDRPHYSKQATHLISSNGRKDRPDQFYSTSVYRLDRLNMNLYDLCQSSSQSPIMINNTSPVPVLMDHIPSFHYGIKEVSGEWNLAVYISKKVYLPLTWRELR